MKYKEFIEVKTLVKKVKWKLDKLGQLSQS